jgi:hypothetical protein
MKAMLGRVAATAVLLVTAGCSLVAPAAQLKTAAEPPQACMDALTRGTLTRDPQSGLGLAAADGTRTPVEWPFGYSARNELGKIVLVDETGRTIAREGDVISVGGGFGDRLWYACAPVTVVTPAS